MKSMDNQSNITKGENVNSKKGRVIIRGETIHRIYGASRFSDHDSVHNSFSPSFDTARITQVSVNKSCQLAAN